MYDSENIKPTPASLFGLELRFRNVEEAIQLENKKRKEIMDRKRKAGLNKHANNGKSTRLRDYLDISMIKKKQLSKSEKKK